MLTLSSGSACDVCAEEYGPQCLPHSIPCGHVLCASCCNTIVEKASRLPPACPFCRESFTTDSVRLIRMDFTTSGWSTPRRYPTFDHATDFTGELLAKRTEHLLRSDSIQKSDSRRLEDKVARIAAKKCSVEEVSTLHKELEDWLRSGKDDQSSSLFLSAALLRAILMNHLAHSEASRIAKANELAYKEKIDSFELTTQKLEADLKRQRKLYEQKSQECQLLRSEVSQLRSLATSLGASALPPTTALSSASASASAAASSSEPTAPTSPRATSPTSPTLSSSRYNALHSRSISMSSSSSSSVRPTTPATPSPLSRSQTPALSMLSHSSTRNHLAPSMRSMTPAIGMGRSYTPAPISSRSMTPGPGSHYSSASAYASRSQTPAPSSSSSHSHSHAHSHFHHSHSHNSSPTNSAQPPPPIPPKPRRLSTPSPPKMMVRSTSEEKADARERWLPPLTTGGGSDRDRVLVETTDGGSYYKKMMNGGSTRAIHVGGRT